MGMKSISVPIGGEGSSPLPMPSKNSVGDRALTSARDKLPGPARRSRMACSWAIHWASVASRFGLCIFKSSERIL
ncbi:hypothetical protein D9M71_831750 [compost metagenome]